MKNKCKCKNIYFIIIISIIFVFVMIWSMFNESRGVSNNFRKENFDNSNIAFEENMSSEQITNENDHIIDEINDYFNKNNGYSYNENDYFKNLVRDNGNTQYFNPTNYYLIMNTMQKETNMRLNYLQHSIDDLRNNMSKMSKRLVISNK